MQRIGLYHAPDVTLTECDTDDLTVTNVRAPTDLVTIADYEFTEEAVLTDHTTVYDARLIQFHFESPLLGIELETRPQSFESVVERVPATLSPVSLPPESLWDILNAADCVGRYDLQIDHPVFGTKTIEDIATPLSETWEDEPIPDSDDIEQYYNEARDNQYPIRVIPYICISGTDARFQLGQWEDEPLALGPLNTLTAGQLTVIGTFLRDHALSDESAAGS